MVQRVASGEAVQPIFDHSGKRLLHRGVIVLDSGRWPHQRAKLLCQYKLQQLAVQIKSINLDSIFFAGAMFA